jgi:hypothetical protein
MPEFTLRCPSDKFGVAVSATGYLRVRCRGKFCKAPEGYVTFHIFDLTTGTLLRTERLPYRNPSELLGSQVKIKESA